MADILANANEILVDFNGNRAYLTDDKLYVYDATDTTETPGYIRHNNSDLGEPSVDKHLNGIDIDYEGMLLLYMYQDGVAQKTFTVPYSADRTTLWMHYPTMDRVPFQKIYFHVYTVTTDTTIYGLEVDFNVTKRRRSG